MAMFNDIMGFIRLICGMVSFLIMMYEHKKGNTQEAIFYGIFALILTQGISQEIGG